MIGPEPFIALASSVINFALEEYVRKKQQKEWKTLKGLKHSKKFLNDNVEGWDKLIYSGGRQQVRLIMGALTGHMPIRHILHKMGLSSNRPIRGEIGIHGTLDVQL